MSDKQKILRCFPRLDAIPGNIDFQTILVDLVEKELGKSTIDAQAFAQANVKKYWNWFNEDLDQQGRRGIRQYFGARGGGTYAISHSAYSLQSSSDAEEQLAGQLALSRPDILRQLDALNDRQYEAMACVACNVLGARFQVLTPPGNEGGIDFIATLKMDSSCHIFSSIGSELRVVGQCKKYQTPVAVDRVEQFLQTMSNVRHRSERVRKHLPVWFDEARGPIVGWVVAHNGFQSGAADEAKRHGLILSDTLDMAELFSFAPSFYVSDSPPVRAGHLLTRCQALLS
nr:restriction endonuclease [uncultured Rhodoferax sp.]